MEDKVIVTHRAALNAKYGPAGVAKIKTALDALVAADKGRGLKTRIVYLDNAPAMKKLGAVAVASSKNVRGAKAAIDGVYKKLKPDYLMILGSSDVVPHQDLTNPAFDPADPESDADRFAFGDLPYACDEGYSRDVAKFVGPTRVVGRLPDLTGAKEPSHLLGLLKTATNWKGRAASSYEDYFGISAAVWEGSTTLSLDNIFGNHNALKLAPPKGPSHPKRDLDGLMHFINCHGDVAVPEFYGQTGNSFPLSLTTKHVGGKIKDGTVASVECCYGGELYNSEVLGNDIPICQSYLRQGAYGYLGSTTIAYGPADGNGAADLICQYFLLNVFGGASLGRAALVARQDFVANAAQMDPIDLKTLAQFCLYGDPSIHPVMAPHAAQAPKDAEEAETARFRRSERRAKLKQTGDFLQATKPTASKRDTNHRVAPRAKTTLARLAANNGLSRDRPFVPYKVKGAPPARGGAKKLATAPARYYLTIGVPKGRRAEDRYLVAVVAKEVAGRIVDYCVYHER
jgi:hypothetical protein